MSETKAKRTRNYATVVYPESAAEHWQEILSQQFIPCMISPLHDSDLNPTGEPKKPHYHVIFMYDSVKTIEQAREVIELIGGVGCEVVQSIRGYARYLCHLDNPEKAQYKPDDVRCLCGADYLGIIGLAIDRYVVISEMQDYVKNNDVHSFAELADYARNERMDWFRSLCDNSAYIMDKYIKSIYWGNKV